MIRTGRKGMVLIVEFKSITKDGHEIDTMLRCCFPDTTSSRITIHQMIFRHLVFLCRCKRTGIRYKVNHLHILGGML